jgi:transmembrane sensor
MTSSPWYLDPASEEQAALWAARLDGSSLTATDRAALDAWLTEDSAHRALLSRYCQFSADLEQQLPALVEAGALELPSGSAPRRSVRWLKWGAGAVLATAAAAALMFWLGRPQTQTENLATPTAMRQTLTLADGSRAELNAQTSLRIEIDGKARRLRLASGEVFFAVRKDASRPFTVETPAGSVRVTGTQFDVRAESPATLEVTVVDGSVQARLGDAAGRPGAPVSLAAGEQLSAGPSGVEVHALTPAALVPLREALARFARYHGRGIMATADTAELRVGGRFSLDDLDGFFAALEEALPVRVTRNLNGTVQVSLRIER